MEILTFSLAAGTDEAAFLATDAQIQALMSSRTGMLRRTTARAATGGEWMVTILWWSEEAADEGMPQDGLGDLAAFVDAGTVVRRRYLTLD